MQIEFRTTTDISPTEWESYTAAFNQVFEKKHDIHFFRHKYLLTIDARSYHVFLKEESNIVGGCTVIPYEYYFEEEIIKTGLAVDVFILPEFRTDPYALYRMYKALKTGLIQNDIALVIAVPNDIAYPYWKNVVKWKDIGFLNYYALPVKLGAVISKLPVFINPLSKAFSYIMVFFANFFSSTEALSKIRINRNNKIIEQHRYSQDHIQFRNKKFYFSYRMVNEKGVSTCYLIDFYNINKEKKDVSALKKAIQTILTTHSVDIIIFVGKLNFLQLLLFKIPFKFEPRHLYFTSDILIPEKVNDALISNIHNWDFGLFNYDVR